MPSPTRTSKAVLVRRPLLASATFAVSVIATACSAAVSSPGTLATGGADTINPTAGPTASSGGLPASSSFAAVRPGYILLEHFGNAADGTPLADGQRHLWLVKADGTDLHELLPGQPDTLLAGPRAPGYKGKQDAAWSPDSTRIAFETESDNGTVIYETDVNGTAPRLVSTDCQQRDDDGPRPLPRC